MVEINFIGLLRVYRLGGDPLGLATRPNNGKYHIFFDHKLDSEIRYSSDAVQFNDANKAFIEKMESNPSF